MKHKNSCLVDECQKLTYKITDRNDSQRYKVKKTSFLYDDEEIPF
jgi:hypothetical protein